MDDHFDGFHFFHRLFRSLHLVSGVLGSDRAIILVDRKINQLLTKTIIFVVDHFSGKAL